MAKGIRVIALAKELGVLSRDILEKLRIEGQGDKATSAQNTLTVGLADTVREWFRHAHSPAATAVETAAPVPEEAPPAMQKSSRLKKCDWDSEEYHRWLQQHGPVRGSLKTVPVIRAMTIGGFKSICLPVTIPLRAITLLYGPNSAGKSSIIHAIHYATEYLNTGLHDLNDTRSGGSSVHLGGFRNIVHRHDPKGVITLGFDVSPGNHLRNDLGIAGPGETASIDPGYAVNLKIDVSGLTEYCLALADEPLAIWRKEKVVTGFGHQPMIERGTLYVNACHPAFSVWPHSLSQGGEELLGLGEWCKGFGEPDPQKKGWRLMPFVFGGPTIQAQPLRGHREAALGQLLQGPLTNLARILGRSQYVGPLRSVPPRDWSSIGDHADPATGLAAWRDLARTSDRAMLDRVNRWLTSGEHFDTGYRIEGGPYHHVLIDGRNGDIAVGVADVGKGIAQVVPVIVAALRHEASLLMLEQPELHLHPRGQAVIGDLLSEFRIESSLASSSSPATSGVALVETHSECLVLRLMKRIRQTATGQLPNGMPQIRPEHVAVLYVKPQGDAGARVVELRLDDKGDFIDRWPDGFFDEQAEELLS